MEHDQFLPVLAGEFLTAALAMRAGQRLPWGVVKARAQGGEIRFWVDGFEPSYTVAAWREGEWIAFGSRIARNTLVLRAVNTRTGETWQGPNEPLGAVRCMGFATPWDTVAAVG
jgi:hypothetical protein